MDRGEDFTRDRAGRPHGEQIGHGGDAVRRSWRGGGSESGCGLADEGAADEAAAELLNAESRVNVRLSPTPRACARPPGWTIRGLSTSAVGRRVEWLTLENFCK
ncbi:hypothetical protein GCM10010446_28860 [Streptomyces enissocaesilis]|uniref:Uncharacterized protein n=1 Tax=Streptomyces enissocaesilis TaxID=332589 RepID=A0ABN3X8S5_9ACTN